MSQGSNTPPRSSGPLRPHYPPRLTDAELDALADTIPVLIKRYDTEQRCIYISKNSERLTAKPPSWFIGRRLDDYEGYPEDFITPIKRSIATILETGAPQIFETSLQKPWGMCRRVHHQCPEYDYNGKIISIVSLSVDITDKHNSHTRLEQILREQGNFLAMLAHELRNPLGAVLSGLQALDREPSQEIAKALREVMHREITHITRLVEDLLDTARIETGTLKYKKKACLTRDFLLVASEIVSAAIASSGQTLILPRNLTDVRLKVDTTRVAQALSNLLHNASKFSPHGSTIEVRKTVDNGSIHLDVIDQGVGISPNSREAIFDRYTQDEREHDQHSSGLGLGLFVSRQIIREHGGDITLLSTCEAGTTFRITLPVYESGEELSPTESSLSSSIPSTSILLIDDNVAALETMRFLLELNGHRVFTATTGSQGLEMYERERPSVVLFDIGLPDMNGRLMAQRLRLLPAEGRPLFIALTGRASEQEEKLSFAAGFDAHLSKPANVDEITSLISRHLEKVA